MSLVDSYVEQIRLMVGDTDTTWYYLEDSTYEYLYAENGNDNLRTAIAALENIINYIALNPTEETLGEVNGKGLSVTVLERRLVELKATKTKDSYGNKRIPMVMRSDRKSWEDFDELFGYNK